MLLRSVLIVLIGLGVAIPGYAEFYRYTDENGVLRFTDDLARVPEAQRPKVKKYLETDDSLTRQQGSREEQQEEEGVTLGAEEVITAASDEDRVHVYEKLKAEKTALDQEYADLVAEKERLSAKSAGLPTEAEIKAYNEEIDSLNLRIAQFEERRQAFFPKSGSL